MSKIQTGIMLLCGVMTLFTLSQSFRASIRLNNPLLNFVGMKRKPSLIFPEKNKKNVQVETMLFNDSPLRQFRALKVASTLINNVVGSSLTCFLGLFGLFLSANLDEIFLAKGARGPKSYSKLTRWMFSFLNDVAILALSADVCRQVVFQVK